MLVNNVLLIHIFYLVLVDLQLIFQINSVKQDKILQHCWLVWKYAGACVFENLCEHCITFKSNLLCLLFPPRNILWSLMNVAKNPRITICFIKWQKYTSPKVSFRCMETSLSPIGWTFMGQAFKKLKKLKTHRKKVMQICASPVTSYLLSYRSTCIQIHWEIPLFL